MMSTANIPSQDQPQSSPGIETTFVSEGIRCAATLHLPSHAHNELLPAILMVHGWGGVQDLFTPPFYRAFVNAGFAVMTFDYANWGKSEGTPRNAINPWRHLQNAEDALAHLQSMPQIDRSRIFLWGTSLGGGHVIDLAARHPELLGCIAQMPMLDGLASVAKASPMRALHVSVYVLADLVNWRGPVYVPTISPPGKLGTLDSDGAYDALQRFLQETGLPYSNKVTASSILSLAFYQPRRRLRNVRIPTLLIGALRDSVTPFSERMIQRAHNVLLETRLIDANHFEPYVKPVFSVSIAYQLEFLKARLPER